MTQDTVLVERDGPVAIVRLNLPERLNPLALPLQERLRAVMAELAADRSVRALVLTGAGKAFCVGADLSGMQPSTDGRSLGEWTHDTMVALSNRLVEDLRGLPFPVVAAVNGPCAGAGVGLALAADIDAIAYTEGPGLGGALLVAVGPLKTIVARHTSRFGYLALLAPILAAGTVTAILIDRKSVV